MDLPDLQTDFLSTNNAEVNKRRKKLIILCGILATPVTIYIALYLIFSLLGAGSYVFAQEYEFNVNETTLINTIENFKKGARQSAITDTIQDGRTDDSFYYYITFYDTEADRAYGFWTRSETNDKTIVALYAVSYGNQLKEYESVNEHLGGYWRSRRVEKSFEKNVLDKLGIKYKCLGNSMSICGVQF